MYGGQQYSKPKLLGMEKSESLEYLSMFPVVVLLNFHDFSSLVCS